MVHITVYAGYTTTNPGIEGKNRADTGEKKDKKNTHGETKLPLLHIYCDTLWIMK